MLQLDETNALAWGEIIGQKRVKRTLEEYVAILQDGNAMPNFGLWWPPGFGKTALLKAFGRLVTETGNGKRIGCYIDLKGKRNKTESSMLTLYDTMYNALSGDGPAATVILDEAFSQESNGSGNDEIVQMLSKIGADQNDKTSVHIYGTDGNREVMYSNRRLNVLLASWNPTRARNDVLSRFPQTEALQCETYSDDDLMQIMESGLPRYIATKAPGHKGKVKLNYHAKRFLSGVLRGNARFLESAIFEPIYRLAMEKGKDVEIMKGDAVKLTQENNLLPYGINKREAAILHELAKNAATTKELKAMTGMKNDDIFIESTLYLRSQGGKECPFQCYDKDGNPTERGEMIINHRGTWYLTEHGQVMIERFRAAGYKI